MNQDIVLAVALPITLFFIMFAMGTKLSLKDFSRLIQTPSAVITGLVAQMILLPFLAFLLLGLFDLKAQIFVGFMILALSPGGTTSNMFSYMAKANVALSITLTAIVSLITPFTIPLIGGLIIKFSLGLSTAIELPFLITVAKLTVVTLIPALLGMWLKHSKPMFCEKFKKQITIIPLIMLLMVIGGIIFNSWQQMPEFLSQTAIPSLLLASLALFAGYYFAKLLGQNSKNARTIAIETSIQNGGVAILVTGTILNNPQMTIAPVMYGILMLIPMFIYLGFLKFSSKQQ